jgi:phosphohistidine phosphatase
VKTLYLLRHAKSSWDDPGLDDRDRPLAPRGRRAAKRIAAHLRRSGIAPELVLCSPARRTRDTLERIATALPDPPVKFEPGLYAASEGHLLEVVQGVAPDVESLLVIGHNPGLHDLALSLAGRGDSDTLERLREKLPTGALATLTFTVTAWADVGPGEGELVGYVLPRQLP